MTTSCRVHQCKAVNRVSIFRARYTYICTYIRIYVTVPVTLRTIDKKRCNSKVANFQVVVNHTYLCNIWVFLV